MNRILVWDWPVRIGHWLLVVGFALAWLTAESESLHGVHVLAGGMVLGVASFRVLWGLIGTRHARFASFVRGPAAIKAYLQRCLRLDPPEYTGHNPAGAVAIVLLLTLGIASSLLGWALEIELGDDWLEEVHEFFASAMLTVAGLHVLGVAADRVLFGANLLKPMFDGHKQGEAANGIRSARPLAAVLMLVWVVCVCAWLLAQSPG